MAELKFKNGVAVLCEPIKVLTQAIIDQVVYESRNNGNNIARVNFHPSLNDSVQEMIICMTRDKYVPAHCHPGKSESFHLISGEVRVGFLNSQGALEKIVKLSENGTRYFRCESNIIHIVIPVTDIVVIHETTLGPFLKDSASVFPHIEEIEKN
jgi:cupin fold WbuC family metalloprotein